MARLVGAGRGTPCGAGLRETAEGSGGTFAEVQRLGCSRDAADTQAREGLGAEHRGRRTQLKPQGQGAVEAPER